MEFLDEMPPDNNKAKTKPTQHSSKKKQVKTVDEYALEIGALTFYMGDVELEVKDIKVKDMEEFREFLMEVMDK